MMNDKALFDSIAARDNARLQATLDGDIDKVANIIGSSLRYVHGSGADEDRTTYLQKLRDGYYRYEVLKSKRRDFRRFGETVLVHGDLRIKVNVNGTVKEFDNRYLQVWANEGEEWRMVAWESTPMPPSKP